MDRIDYIITEEIDNYINEGVLSDIKDFFKKAFNKYFKKVKNHKKDDDEDNEPKKKEKHRSKKDKEKKKNPMKTKKTIKGGKVSYNYDDYKSKHREISKGDASSIRDVIDQDRTNIRDLSKEIFPDHTEAGAQSQLRKILNGDRKMTKDVAHKLSKGISSGEIATK